MGEETTYALAGVGGRRAQGVSRGGHAGTRAASRWDMRVERSEVREQQGIVRVRDVQRGAEGTRAGAQVGEGGRSGTVLLHRRGLASRYTSGGSLSCTQGAVEAAEWNVGMGA